MLQHRENKKEYDGSESNLVYTRVVEELEMEHIKKQAKTKGNRVQEDTRMEKSEESLT